MFQRLVHAAIPLVLLLVLSATVYPQGERATISGTVTDSSQAVVAGAAITVRNVDTNVASRAVSNASGLFVIPRAAARHLRADRGKAGIPPFKISEIPLSVGLTATVDVQARGRPGFRGRAGYRRCGATGGADLRHGRDGRHASRHRTSAPGPRPASVVGARARRDSDARPDEPPAIPPSAMRAIPASPAAWRSKMPF